MKRQRFKVNDRYEVKFLDHSSNNATWRDVDEIKKDKDFEICLVGYYICSNKYTHTFGMAFSNTTGHYSPVFKIVKSTILRWRKLKH